jgi:hypothetical protein
MTIGLQMSPAACARRHECARARDHDAKHQGQATCAGTACPRFVALLDELLLEKTGQIPATAKQVHFAQ